MQNEVRIVFAGGGTGGHVFPALNLAKAIGEHRPARFLFFGTSRGLEMRLVPRAGYQLELIPVAGWQRRLTTKNLSVPWKLYKSMQQSRKALKKFKPHLVIGTGGYVMGPVLKTAQRMGIATVLQEQNSFPGVTTRLLASRAKLVFAAYKEVRQHLNDEANLVVCGNPISARHSEQTTERLYEKFGLNPQHPVLLVFGGSQGAHHINLALQELLENDNPLNDYQLLWQTGLRDFEQIRGFVKRNKLKNINVLPFIDDMAGAYKLARLAICRAGAMTLSELMFHGVPAILVPLASAAGNHQYKNAQALQQVHAAELIADDANLAVRLRKQLEQLLPNTDRQKAMGEQMQALHRPDTYEIILAKLDALLQEEGIENAN